MARNRTRNPRKVAETGYAVNMLKVGDVASRTAVATEEVVATFARISGDLNPVHLDESYAKDTIFGSRIAHGLWTASLISAVIGMELPGPGSIYLSQNMKFLSPVYIGDSVTAIVRVTAIRDDKPIVTLETLCVNQDEKRVLEGEAVVLFPELRR